MCNLKRNQKEGVKYSCNQCNYQATQQVSLKTHKKSVHGGVKYSCSQYDYYHQCDNFNFSLTLHSKILTLSISGFLKNRKDWGGGGTLGSGTFACDTSPKWVISEPNGPKIIQSDTKSEHSSSKKHFKDFCLDLRFFHSII